MMVRTCVECGADFEARSSRAKRCGAACRKRSSRKAQTPPPFVAPPDATCLTDAVLARVAGAESTPEAQAALVLSRRVDSGGESLAAMAAATKEISRLLALVDPASVAGTTAAPSNPLDDLAQRRERRAAV
jgi:hypothetical protein